MQHASFRADTSGTVLDTRRILAFGLPVAATSVLVALSGPALNGILGRSDDPVRDLAAFWIAFTVVLFVESGSLAVQTAALALGADRGPLARVGAASLAIGALSSAALLALATPAGAHLLFAWIVPTTPVVASLAAGLVGMLVPLPVLVAMRGLAAAVALRRRCPDVVAAGAAVRVGAIAAASALGISAGVEAGAHAAVRALVVGTAAECVLLLGATAPWIRARLRRGDPANGPGMGRILRVATPLVLATLAWTATRPVVNAVLGRLADPGAAQAAFGVVLPLLMVAGAPLWALQELTVVLPRDRAELRRVVRFATGLAAAFTLALAALAFTPLGPRFLAAAFGLPPAMVAVVTPALAVLVAAPAALAARTVAQGVLLRSGRTGMFLALAPTRLGAMLGAGLLAAALAPSANGAVLGLALIVGVEWVDALLYGWHARRVLRADLVAPARAFPPSLGDPAREAA